MFKKELIQKSVVIENQLQAATSMFQKVIKNLDSIITESEQAQSENELKIKELKAENDSLSKLSFKAAKIVNNIGALLSE